MGRSIKALALSLITATAAIVGWNYATLQRPVSQVLLDDSRNSGIEVFAHYQWFVNPRVLVFDLRSVSGDNSPLDVSRILLQSADSLQDKKFDRVILSYKGTAKFTLKGDYFHTLGVEYAFQNPVYTLRTLPENVFDLDGSPAFGTWTGGVLGVVGKQMEDLNELHERWYLSDFAGGS